MKISFVIPCYRSSGTIRFVVDEIRSAMSRRPATDFEVVMVSDHSPDDVYRVIEDMCRNDPGHLRGMELARNFGQHAALLAGYSRSTGDYVVSLDDDGQTPVSEVWALVDKLETDGVDVVYASYSEKKHSRLRNWGSWVNDRMACWLLDKPRALKVTSYFVARRFVIDEILRYNQAFPYVIGLVLRTTRSIANVPVIHRERIDGVSGYTFPKLVALWTNGFTAFSVKPLRVASLAGVFCAMGGFLYGLWTIVNKIAINPDAPLGYSSLMSALLFIGGVLMLILGLIGEYVGRIYICLNHSPQYVISKETGT